MYLYYKSYSDGVVWCRKSMLISVLTDSDLVIIDHFSGPGRANGSVYVFVCVCVRTITLKEMTFDQNICHASSPWHYLGQV